MPTRHSALQLRFDSFELNEADARLKRDGKPVALAPKAFGVLCALARQPGQLVTKDELLDAVWGHRHVSESVLKTTISELRAALSDDARKPRYIETASRRGYRFIAAAVLASEPVTAVGLADPAMDLRTGAAFATRTIEQVPLVGREAELDTLRDAWARAQAGERQLVWVTGEAGVGKTRLIERFLSELPPGTATFGQCVEDFGTGDPYLPILEAVRELCRRDPDLVAAMRFVAPTWLVQLPWLVSAEDRASMYTDVGGARQDRMVREMRELMDRFTAKRPLIFVLEDLHWSDQGTLRMMEHFARRPREVRLMWIASFRLTQVIAEDHPLRALRQELRLHKLIREIALDPFTETEVASYLGTRMPAAELPESFVKRVHAHTDGLPLFVANVADSVLAQTGGDAALLRDVAGSTEPLPVPDSLAGVIEKQIGRLPAATQSLLEAASVLGTEFRSSYLATLTGRDIDAVCDDCDQLVRREFWIRLASIDETPDGGIDPRYVFLHALYKHVFYERISLPQRIQLHRRVLRELEAARATGIPIAAAELASHAERGHVFASALRYYGEAADHAVGHFAPAEALGLTASGLKLLGRVADGPERVELELGLVHRRGIAAAQLQGVASAEAMRAFERTLALLDVLPATPQRALLLSGIGLSRYVCGQYVDAEKLAARVFVIGEEHGDDILRASASLLLGMVHAARGEHSAAVTTMEYGIAAAERIEQVPPGVFIVDPTAAMHSNIAIPLMSLGRCDEARQHIERAHARAKLIGQPTAQMLALWADGMVSVRAEERMRVIECATILQRVVAHSMLAQGDGPALWLRGWALAQAGKAREGHKLIREGYEIHAKLGMFAGNSETLGYAAEALLLANDLVHADRQLDEAIALADKIDERVMYPYLLRLRGAVAASQDAPERAREILCDALASARRQQAPYEELKCLLALVKYGVANRHERAAMRHVYATLKQGRDLAFMKSAASFLD